MGCRRLPFIDPVDTKRGASHFALRTGGHAAMSDREITLRRESEEISAAVGRAVTMMMSAIEGTMERWEKTAPQVIVEFALIDLCEQVPDLVESLEMGPATKKLLAAMAEYKDSQFEDR
jgi:hypothetical protein